GQFIAHWIVGRGGWALLVGWYLGNTAVVVGSLLSFPLLVDLGGVVLLVPLVIMLWIALQPGRIAGSTRSRSAEIGRLLLMAALVIMIFSIPVGLVLAHNRAYAWAMASALPGLNKPLDVAVAFVAYWDNHDA